MYLCYGVHHSQGEAHQRLSGAGSGFSDHGSVELQGLGSRASLDSLAMPGVDSTNGVPGSHGPYARYFSGSGTLGTPGIGLEGGREAPGSDLGAGAGLLKGGGTAVQAQASFVSGRTDRVALLPLDTLSSSS